VLSTETYNVVGGAVGPNHPNGTDPRDVPANSAGGGDAPSIPPSVLAYSGRCTLVVGALFGWGTCNQPQTLSERCGFPRQVCWCGDAWQQASLLVFVARELHKQVAILEREIAELVQA
jgi:hypothetical protein